MVLHKCFLPPPSNSYIVLPVSCRKKCFWIVSFREFITSLIVVVFCKPLQFQGIHLSSTFSDIPNYIPWSLLIDLVSILEHLADTFVQSDLQIHKLRSNLGLSVSLKDTLTCSKGGQGFELVIFRLLGDLINSRPRTLFLFFSALTIYCSSECSSSTVDKHTSACAILSVQSASSFLVSSISVRIPLSLVENLDWSCLLPPISPLKPLWARCCFLQGSLCQR